MKVHSELRLNCKYIYSIIIYLCICYCSAEESINDILQASFTNFDDDDADYPDTSRILKMSSFPKPVPTKSSLLMENARKDKSDAVRFCSFIVIFEFIMLL